MEPIYEATGRMTGERYRRFFEIHCRVTKQATVYTVFAVMLLIFGIAEVFLSVGFWRILACGMFSFSAFFFLYPRIASAQYAKMMEKTAKGQFRLPFTIRFFEEEWIGFTPKGEIHLRYDEIFRVAETVDAIVIYTGYTQAYVLYRNEFTRGDAAHFLSFLRFQKQVPYQFV